MDRRLYGQLRRIEETHWWFRGRREILTAALDRLEVRGRAILDVGCGAGTNLDLLRRCNPGSMVVGIDIAGEPLLFCQEDRPLPVVQADVAHLPFSSCAFDLVAALDTLEHVEQDRAVLTELNRVCRPNGTLLLTVPAFPALWGNIDELGHHFRRYRKRDLIDRVVRAGFSVRFVRFFNCLLFPPIAAVRLMARLMPAQDPRPLRSDFDLVKQGPMNAFLAKVFSAEARLLGMRLPFGVSLLCVATRA